MGGMERGQHPAAGTGRTVHGGSIRSYTHWPTCRGKRPPTEAALLTLWFHEDAARGAKKVEAIL